jgi:type II secretory pathway component PulF
MALIVTPRQLVQRGELYHQLAQLTAAGVGIIQSFEMLHRSPPSRTYREPLRKVIDTLKSGSTLTEALQAAGRWLPSFDTALIHAGETSGRLPNCFRLLADHYNDRARLMRQIMSNLAYPLALFHFAFLIFPLSSLQNLVWKGDVLGFLYQKALFFAPFYAAVSVVLYMCQGQRGEIWRAVLERIFRLIPVLGSARRSLALARLSAALEALISAGVTIIEAWEIAVLACGSPALAQAVLGWRPQLEAGQTHAELVNDSREFPEVFANLYNTGEVSGKIDENLLRLHTYFQEDAERKTRALAEWSPRVVYFLIVLVIAYQIVSFWTGYFAGIANAINF